VLVEPEGKINMGFIIRLCKNFSIEDICVVNPAFSLDDPEIVEFSAKASDYLKKIRLEKNLEKCLKGSKVIVCTTSKSRYESDLLRQGVSPHVLSHILPSDGIVSLVFGRESVGLRRSELLNLTLTDIDSERMVLHIKGAKGKKDRIFLLSENLLQLLC